MLAAVLGDFAGWHIPFVVLGMAMLLAALIFLYSFPTKNYHRLILIWLGG
jgi:predicted MFS family arabinose efflux permease